MNNQNYWINRSNQRMYEYLSDSHKVISEIEKAYRESERYIKSETDNIFRNFVNHTGISETEARLLLKTSIGKTTVDKLKSALSSVKDEDIRKQMLAEINMPAYQARIKRFEELNSNIVKECNRLYGTELKMSTNLYTDIADKAFSRTIYDIQKGTGIGYSFAQLPKSRIEEILRNNWSGKHYSQRIWGNTRKLADDLKQDLLSGLLSGKSGRKIAEDISRRYGVGIHNAERLVRTESNYIANQAEIESYKESGIEKYRYIATLDSRTSEVCRELDGKEFLVSEAQAGVNLPPMHAHCRSTTISVINEKCLENLERRARKSDGTTEKVPADMTYREWKESFMKNSVDINTERGIIEVGSDNMVAINERNTEIERNLPNGLRTTPIYILSDDEIAAIKKDIDAINADEAVFHFNEGRKTGYVDELDIIRVRGDVLPDKGSTHPRDMMSVRAVLAHEYYGHRANRGTTLPPGSWNDEFRASYMAAKNCPNLSDEDRYYLILDALERAKESGVSINYNAFIRECLYGK